MVHTVQRPRLLFAAAVFLFTAITRFLSCVDFRHVIYSPTRAALDGVNPYDAELTTGLEHFRGSTRSNREISVWLIRRGATWPKTYAWRLAPDATQFVLALHQLRSASHIISQWNSAAVQWRAGQQLSGAADKK